MSPDELTTEQLEKHAQQLRGVAERSVNNRDYYLARADEYDKLLKERAEAGTY